MEGDPLAAGRGESRIACGGEPAVRRPHDRRDTRILPEHRPRVVGRAVIDDHHLEVPERLGEDALQALGEVRGAVVGRDDDRDERHGGGGARSVRAASSSVKFVSRVLARTAAGR